MTTGITLGGLIGAALAGAAIGFGWTVGTALGRHVTQLSGNVVAKVGTMKPLAQAAA